MRGAIKLAVLACLLAAFWLVFINHNSEDAGKDSDGDGLSDALERKLGTNLSSVDTDRDGIDDWFEANPSKQVFIGAEHYPSPAKMDVYVEVQYMLASDHSHAMPLEAKERIIQLFANAPVKNPDGTRGIRLHIIGGGAIAHADPITDEANIFTTRGAINGWNNLYLKWHESSPRSRISHYVIIAHYLDDEATFLASHSPGNSFVLAGARLKTIEDWVLAFTLGIARNIGIPIDELTTLDLSDPNFWSAVQEKGAVVSLEGLDGE